MAKVIEEEGARFADPESLEAQISEYAKIKASMDIMETRAKELREKLFGALDSEGEEDDKGNIVLFLPHVIDGIARIEKQRRASRALDEMTAEVLIDQLGLAEDVYEMKRVINEDALMAAYYEDRISEAQLDEMFPTKVTWALRTVKK